MQDQRAERVQRHVGFLAVGARRHRRRICHTLTSYAPMLRPPRRAEGPGAVAEGQAPSPVLLLAGVPIPVVAARLGHAHPAITLRVYAHYIGIDAIGGADPFASALHGESVADPM
jgi:integrase